MAPAPVVHAPGSMLASAARTNSIVIEEEGKSGKGKRIGIILELE